MHEILTGGPDDGGSELPEPGDSTEATEAADSPTARGRTKRLKAEHAVRLAQHLFCPTRLDHGPDQAAAARYFVLLARYFDLPRNEAEFIQRELLALRRAHGRRVLRPESEDAARYFGSWALQPIRQLVLLDDFQPDGGWMSRRLGGRVTAAEAEADFAWLQARGHIVQDGERWVLARSAVVAPQEVDQVAGFQALLREALGLTYRKALTVAGDAIDEAEPHQRLLRMKVVNLSQAAFARLRQTLEDLIQQVDDEVAPEEAPTQEVYQLLLTLVPISRRDRGGAP